MTTSPKINRLLVLLGLIFMSTCAAAAPLPVVASFSIIGDWVAQVGGERVQVHTLIGPNQDAHAWQPSPSVAKQFAGARLVVLNGLGLDARVSQLALVSGFRGPLVLTSTGFKAFPMHEHGGFDPHVWQDIAAADLGVQNITAALIGQDPAGAAYYQARSQAYRQQLSQLATWAQQQFASLKPAQRRAIVSHDAFAYFARRFGLQLIPVQGKSGEGQASAQLVAGLIQQIKNTKLQAVFVENINNSRLTRQIASETGVTLGAELYSDALSPAGGPAANYLDFYRYNVTAFVNGMRRN